MRTSELIGKYTKHIRQHGLRMDCPMGGDLNAEAAFIGEYPHEYEVKLRTPFVGNGGALLFKSARALEIKRTDLYITHVVKRQLVFSAHSDERASIERKEISHWNELLWWELSHCPNLKVVIAFGDMAIAGLIATATPKKLVGNVYSVTNPVNGKDYQVICNFNPNQVVKEPTNEIVFRFILAKLKRALRGEILIPQLNYIINPSYGEAHDYIEYLADQSERFGTPVAYDIETVSMETACVGIGGSSSEAMCINLRDQDDHHFTSNEEVKLHLLLQSRLLGNRNVKLVAQNGSFDAYWLHLSNRIAVAPLWMDTLLAHHTLYPGLPHRLEFLCMQYTDIPFYKSDLHKWHESADINDLWEYNCKDVITTFVCAQKLAYELEQMKLDRFFFDHVMRAQPWLLQMTVGGLPVDMKLKEALNVSLAQRVDELREQFHNAVYVATGDPEYTPSPTSPKQLQQLYFGRLGLVGQGVSTDDENRTRMAAHPTTSENAREVLRLHNAFAEHNKFYTTYVKMQCDPDGRIRSDYKQYGTTSAPGRLSSSKLLYGTGGNLQNQPDNAQPMFSLPDDYVFVYYDLSQAEARFVGWDADIEHWIDDFERARQDSSFDCHRSLAAQLYGVPYDEVPHKDIDEDGHKTIRFLAKRCRHGLNYRMAAEKLATTSGIERSLAQRNYDLYHRLTPELRIWWKRLTDEYSTQHELFNAYGRRLPLLRRLDDSALEAVVAFRPQSTIGDKCVRVIYQCQSDPEWPTGKAAVRLNIHDANIAIAHKDVAMRVASIMKRYAEEPITQPHWRMPLIIPADVKISYPVAWEMNDEGKVKYYEDKANGSHRWGFFKTVEV